MRQVLVAAVVLVLTGCGGGREEGETASLWVTRDRGTQVLLDERVPAGLTVMQALDRVADVETRYGGRFVAAIEGIEGSLARQRDWFYFVNGYEGDRSAVEYRLRPGDVAWWDFRSWTGPIREPVVVGAFPEPFRHGYAGKRRAAVVRYRTSELARGARAIARVIGARSVAPASRPVPADANLFLLVAGSRPRFEASLRAGSGVPGDPVVFRFAGDATRLARDPRLARFRYRGLR